MASIRRTLKRSAQHAQHEARIEQAKLDTMLFLSSAPEAGPTQEENEFYRNGIRALFQRAMVELEIPDPSALLRGLRLRRQTYDAKRDGASSHMKLIDAILAQRMREHGIEQLDDPMLDPAYLPSDKCKAPISPSTSSDDRTKQR